MTENLLRILEGNCYKERRKPNRLLVYIALQTSLDNRQSKTGLLAFLSRLTLTILSIYLTMHSELTLKNALDLEMYNNYLFFIHRDNGWQACNSLTPPLHEMVSSEHG